MKSTSMPSRYLLLLAHLHDLAEGLPRRPIYMLAAAVSVPLYTTYVILLQAVNTIEVSTPVLIFVAAMLLGGYGWFMQRMIKGIDDGLKENKEVTAALHKENKDTMMLLTRAIEGLTRNQDAQSKLSEFQEKRIATLEHKKEVLEKSFNEMDKIIDREIIHRKQS